MSKDTKVGNCIRGDGDMFGELAKNPVLLGIASGEWLDLKPRLKIFILFEARRG